MANVLDLHSLIYIVICRLDVCSDVYHVRLVRLVLLLCMALGGRQIATTDHRDTAVQRDIYRSLLYDVVSEHHVLGIERDDVAELWKYVVAACYMSASKLCSSQQVHSPPARKSSVTIL